MSSSSAFDCLTTITANTIDASPRGPNQPMKPIVGARAPDPTMAMATGSIRTSVRLSTAYPASAQLSSPWAPVGPRRIAPNRDEGHAVEDVAHLLAQGR